METRREGLLATAIAALIMIRPGRRFFASRVLSKRIVAGLALALASPVFAQASASPYTSGTRYDGAGRVTGTIAPDPDGDGPLHHLAVRNSYDLAGRLVRVETGELAGWQSEAVAPGDWSGFTVFRTLETGYDALGRKVRESLREGAAGPVRSLTQYSYDAAGRLQCVAIRMNEAQFGGSLPDACTQGGGAVPDRIARTLYDAAGERVQLREGVGTAAEGTQGTWAYDDDGHVATLIDGNGNQAALSYDGHGRQDRWTFPSPARPAAFDDTSPASALASAGSANANDYEAYGYDAAGNRTSLRKRDGSVLGYAYDALNRMSVKTVPERAGLDAAQTRDVHYSYDNRGLQLYARFDSASGEGIANVWDGYGRLAATTSDLGGTARTLSYGYDADGNRLRVKHPDGSWFGLWHDGLDRPFYLYTGATGIAYAAYTPFGSPQAISHGGYTAWSYDGIQRPASLSHGFAGNTGNVAWSFARNPAGQIASETRDNDAYAWAGHYALSRPYATNGLNQYVTAGGATFAYDASGNLTGDGANAFVYDVENRLVSASGAHHARLDYDPLGRLWQVTDTASGAVTRFLYDGDALVAEYDGAGAMTHRYAHWAGADTPMAAFDGTGLSAIHHLFADHEGSIVALADGAGALVATNTYDEYGIPGAANQGRFQYTGQVWLSELGLYYYKARIYSPTLGRFLQTDPIGYADQFNLYAYVGDDPTNGTDPTGTTIRCDNGTCRITADTFRPATSNHATALATPEMRASMSAQTSLVTDRTHETIGSGSRNSDGSYTVHILPTEVHTNNFAQTASSNLPSDAAFGTHWHPTKGPEAVDGMVDSPDDNDGLGDSASLNLAHPIPMATVVDNEVGWREINDGQLSFTVPRRAVTNPQLNRIQANLDREQRRLRHPDSEQH